MAQSTVDPYLFPARGRKQGLHQPTDARGYFARLIPTFSPQGDGNRPRMNRGQLSPHLLIPTFSPQGDGNSASAAAFILRVIG